MNRFPIFFSAHTRFAWPVTSLTAVFPQSGALLRFDIEITSILTSKRNQIQVNLPFCDIPNDQEAVILATQADEELFVGGECQRFDANAMQFMSTLLRLRFPIPHNHIRSIARVTYLTRRHKCTTETANRSRSQLIPSWISDRSLPWRNIDGRYRIRVTAQKFLFVVLHIQNRYSRAQRKD